MMSIYGNSSQGLSDTFKFSMPRSVNGDGHGLAISGRGYAQVVLDLVATKVAHAAFSYERRRPEETTLYQVVQEHLETFPFNSCSESCGRFSA